MLNVYVYALISGRHRVPAARPLHGRARLGRPGHLAYTWPTALPNVHGDCRTQPNARCSDCETLNGWVERRLNRRLNTGDRKTGTDFYANFRTCSQELTGFRILDAQFIERKFTNKLTSQLMQSFFKVTNYITVCHHQRDEQLFL